MHTDDTHLAMVARNDDDSIGELARCFQLFDDRKHQTINVLDLCAIVASSFFLRMDQIHHFRIYTHVLLS